MSKKASNPPPAYPKPPAPAVTPPPPCRNAPCGAPGFVVDLRLLIESALPPGDRLAPDATIEVAGRCYRLGADLNVGSRAKAAKVDGMRVRYASRSFDVAVGPEEVPHLVDLTALPHDKRYRETEGVRAGPKAGLLLIDGMAFRSERDERRLGQLYAVPFQERTAEQAEEMRFLRYGAPKPPVCPHCGGALPGDDRPPA